MLLGTGCYVAHGCSDRTAPTACPRERLERLFTRAPMGAWGLTDPSATHTTRLWPVAGWRRTHAVYYTPGPSSSKSDGHKVMFRGYTQANRGSDGHNKVPPIEKERRTLPCLLVHRQNVTSLVPHRDPLPLPLVRALPPP
jgi:hypothetical protein